MKKTVFFLSCIALLQGAGPVLAQQAAADRVVGVTGAHPTEIGSPPRTRRELLGLEVGWWPEAGPGLLPTMRGVLRTGEPWAEISRARWRSSPTCRRRW